MNANRGMPRHVVIGSNSDACCPLHLVSLPTGFPFTLEVFPRDDAHNNYGAWPMENCHLGFFFFFTLTYILIVYVTYFNWKRIYKFLVFLSKNFVSNSF